MSTIEKIARASKSKSVQKLNPHFFKPGDIMNHGGEDDDELEYIAALNAPKPKKRIRQSDKPILNKLETEFLNRLLSQYPNYRPIRMQALKLQIARGTFYKPDFFVASWPTPDGPAKPTAWEVKELRGKNVDRGKLALKCAASAWPEIRFIFAWKENGQWCEQEILP